MKIFFLAGSLLALTIHQNNTCSTTKKELSLPAVGLFSGLFQMGYTLYFFINKEENHCSENFTSTSISLATGVLLTSLSIKSFIDECKKISSSRIVTPTPEIIILNNTQAPPIHQNALPPAYHSTSSLPPAYPRNAEDSF